MIALNVKVDDDVFQELYALYDRFAPRKVKNAMRKKGLDIRRRMLAELTQEPAQPTHPFIWSFDEAAQDRARRWWFAAIARGEVRTDGHRYIRSGMLVFNWEVVVNDTPNSISWSVENNAPGVDYVQGSKQVPSHAMSGWPNADDIIDKYQVIATDEFIDVWASFGDF